MAGAALVIAGGVAIPTGGAETVLGLGPCRWLGKLSYSLYLWHWPILILAAEYAGKSALPVGENLLLVLVAVAISMVTFRLIENPVRHARLTSRKSVAMGLTLVVATVIFLSLMIASQTTSAPAYRVVPAANEQVVLGQVAAAPHITSLPANLQPSLSQVNDDWGGKVIEPQCISAVTAATETICPIGDVHASRLMVAYGDSHILMWLPALDSIAKEAHYKLIVLSHWYCPASPLTIIDPEGVGPANQPFLPCNQWHRWSIRWIQQHDPSVVLVSQESLYGPPAKTRKAAEFFTPAKWRQGFTSLLASVSAPGRRTIVLGNIPSLLSSPPACLAAHSDVQSCTTPKRESTPPYEQVDRAVTTALGAQYVDPTDWFCSAVCSPVVADYLVYFDAFHVTGTYARYLERVLAKAFALPSS